ncbi:MAG TPA: hypothetical protein VGF93_22160 [Solirubrobacteraceae bacterium]
MRADIDLTSADQALLDRTPAPPGPRPRERRIDGFDWIVLGVFAAISMWVMAVDGWEVVVNGHVWTGTDGVYIVDQMQYLAWIRDAANHVLASNLFVLRSTPHDYFQPAVLISGGITALGVAPWITLLLWKPVAVIAGFWAARTYVNRSLDGLWQRRAGLVLCLFFGCFTVIFGQFGVLGDLFPGFLSWGYTFGLIALAAMVGGLLTYDTALRNRRLAWMPGVLGAIASLLHPWQGEALILLVIASELIVGLRQPITRSRLGLAAVTIGLTGAPLLYYVILTRADLAWHLARQASKHSFPLGSIVIAIVPLMIPALLAYRNPPKTFLAAATRCWPLVAFGVYFLSGTGAAATPLHAFQGITFPLSVLAIEGLQTLRWRPFKRPRLVGALVVAVAAIPATGYELYNAAKLAEPTAGNGNYILAGERDALNYLAADRAPGGVITQGYLGALVPGITGRNTLLGDCLWSEPNCHQRSAIARDLFTGKLGPRGVTRLLHGTQARFVLADCKTKADMVRVLGPHLRSVKQFGCAAVYGVD